MSAPPWFEAPRTRYARSAETEIPCNWGNLERLILCGSQITLITVRLSITVQSTRNTALGQFVSSYLGLQNLAINAVMSLFDLMKTARSPH